MKKSNGGFSLVELIVVIAIMAILAGIAVPTYVKYIAKANDAVLYNELGEVKTAAIATAAKKGATVSAISVTPGDPITVTVTAADSAGTVVAISSDDVIALLDDNKISVAGTSYEDDTALTWAPTTGWADPDGN